MYNFPELADSRERMLEAFLAEQASNGMQPYVPSGMTPMGEEQFPGFMEAALRGGNEMTLANDLDFAPFWNGAAHPSRIAKRVAVTEFNTWYVRGLALRLADEGVESCAVFAADTTAKCAECSPIDGKTLPVEVILAGHRIRYHHETPNTDALAVPLHPECRHSIRRIAN